MPKKEMPIFLILLFLWFANHFRSHPSRVDRSLPPTCLRPPLPQTSTMPLLIQPTLLRSAYVDVAPPEPTVVQSKKCTPPRCHCEGVGPLGKSNFLPSPDSASWPFAAGRAGRRGRGRRRRWTAPEPLPYPAGWDNAPPPDAYGPVRPGPGPGRRLPPAGPLPGPPYPPPMVRIPARDVADAGSVLTTGFITVWRARNPRTEVSR